MSLNFVDELLILDGVGLPHLGQLSLHPKRQVILDTALITDDIDPPRLIDGPDLDHPVEVFRVTAGPDGGASKVTDLHVIIPPLTLKGSANDKLQAARGGAVDLHLFIVAIK